MSAAGNPYFNCSEKRHNLSSEQIFRDVIVDDGNGKPAVRTYQSNSSGGGGSFPSPVGHTPSIERVSQEADTGSGSSSITIVNTGSADGLVGGTTLHPGESVTFSAPLYDTVNSIHYDSSSTEFLITRI